MSSVATTVLSDQAADAPVHLQPAAQALRRFVDFASEHMDWACPDDVRRLVAASGVSGVCRVVEAHAPDMSFSCRVYFDYPLCLSPDLVASLPPFAFYASFDCLSDGILLPPAFFAFLYGCDMTLYVNIIPAGNYAHFGFKCFREQRCVPTHMLSVPEAKTFVHAVNYLATTYPGETTLTVEVYPALTEIADLFQVLPTNVSLL